MLIKITAKGYETFTGAFGSVMFKNAVSVDHVSRMESERLGSIISIVEVSEDGEEIQPVSASQAELNNRDKLAEVKKPLSESQKPLSESQKPVAKEVASSESAPKEVATPESTAKIYTQAELEAIADQKGMVELREIGDAIGARGNSISKLIAKILEVQKAK